jgi:hypothetical protein
MYCSDGEQLLMTARAATVAIARNHRNACDTEQNCTQPRKWRACVVSDLGLRGQALYVYESGALVSGSVGRWLLVTGVNSAKAR